MHKKREALGIELAKRRRFSVVIVGDDFNSLTGVHVSVINFVKRLTAFGHLCHSVNLKSDIKTRQQARLMVMRSDKFIFNSIGVFRNKNAIWMINEILKQDKTAYFYLHETNWGFDTFQRNSPKAYKRLKRCLKLGHVLCVSNQQAEQVKLRFGVSSYSIIYENCQPFKNVPLGMVASGPKDLNAPHNILMVGSIQKRKGVDLFSMADLAQKQRTKLAIFLDRAW